MSKLDKDKFPTQEDSVLFLKNLNMNPALQEQMFHVEELNRYLLTTPEVLDPFLSYRVLDTNRIREYNIGYDKDKKYYSIPIYDEIGVLRGIKYYNHDSHPKFSWDTNPIFDSTNYLYPIQTFFKTNSQIILVEGELDAITLQHHNFPGVSFTGGSSSFKEELSEFFRDKNLIIFYDNDKAGKDGSLKIANKLKNVAKTIKIFDWSLIPNAAEKSDVTDLFRDGLLTDELLFRTLSDLKYFSSNLQKVSFENVFSTDNLDKEFYFETFIIGKDLMPFEFANKFQVKCTKVIKDLDACNNCPLQTKDLTVNVPREDVFNLIQKPESQIKKYLMQKYIMAKSCNYMDFKKLESQFVTQMWGISPPNFSETSRTSNTEKEFYFIGKREIPINIQFIFKSRIITDPQTQRNKIICWDESESSPDFLNYSFTAETQERLKYFQTEDNVDSVIAKLDSLSALLSNYTNIYGRPTLHTFYNLIWHSVLSFNVFNEEVKRGWLQGLLLGDQRTGKSRTARKLTEYFGLGDFVSAEGTSIAGLIGGIDKMPGTGNFILKWGKFPQNDRRLLIVDEAGELGEETIGKLSELRSEGIAQITKIEGQSTFARTRLIMITNPNSARAVASYLYPVEIVKEVIRRPEDIARFDFAMVVSENEVNPALINSIQEIDTKELMERQSAFRESIIWAWSRRQNEVVFTKEAQAFILAQALELGKFYDAYTIPLIQVSNIRIKLARIAAAIAATVMSTKDFNTLIVTKSHVQAALIFIEGLNKRLGYYQFSAVKLEQKNKVAKNKEEILDVLKQFESASNYMYNNNVFHFRDFNVNLGYFDSETAILKRILIQYELVSRNADGSFSKTLLLTDLIKEALRGK